MSNCFGVGIGKGWPDVADRPLNRCYRQASYKNNSARGGGGEGVTRCCRQASYKNNSARGGGGEGVTRCCRQASYQMLQTGLLQKQQCFGVVVVVGRGWPDVADRPLTRCCREASYKNNSARGGERVTGCYRQASYQMLQAGLLQNQQCLGWGWGMGDQMLQTGLLQNQQCLGWGWGMGDQMLQTGLLQKQQTTSHRLHTV